MTTLAVVIGAVPIAMGFGADAATRQPVGLVIVGGLEVSQFISLSITPVTSLYLEPVQEKARDRGRGKIILDSLWSECSSTLRHTIDRDSGNGTL
jgi:hydrophobic/amphiphilic exporter-1 (mainly G- bacteria), HAE1 family